MEKLITIGCRFGSGGHEIGKKIAQKLNIPCYDWAAVQTIFFGKKNACSGSLFQPIWIFVFSAWQDVTAYWMKESAIGSGVWIRQ